MWLLSQQPIFQGMLLHACKHFNFYMDTTVQQQVVNYMEATHSAGNKEYIFEPYFLDEIFLITHLSNYAHSVSSHLWNSSQVEPS